METDLQRKYQLRSWASVVLEVAFITEEYQQRATKLMLRAGYEIVSAGAGAQLPDGKYESLLWLRVSAPAANIGNKLLSLQAMLEEL